MVVRTWPELKRHAHMHMSSALMAHGSLGSLGARGTRAIDESAGIESREETRDEETAGFFLTAAACRTHEAVAVCSLATVPSSTHQFLEG